MSDETLDAFPEEVTNMIDNLPDEDFRCDICGQQAKNARGLKMHKSRSHGSGDKIPSSMRKQTKSSAELNRDLEAILGALGTGVGILNEADGVAILEGTPKLALALTHLAEKNPKVRAFLTNMSTGFVYSELLVAVVAIAIPIMANHNLLPAHTGSFIIRMGAQQEAASNNGGFFDAP